MCISNYQDIPKIYNIKTRVKITYESENRKLNMIKKRFDGFGRVKKGSEKPVLVEPNRIMKKKHAFLLQIRDPLGHDRCTT